MKPRFTGPHVQGLAYLTLVVIAFAIYANGLHSGFVWDDYSLILRSERVRALRSVPRFFVEGFFPEGRPGISAGYYRPLVSASFAVDYAIGGPKRPWVFHLTNLLIYCACVAAVYALYRRLISSWVAAWLGALLFACHAIHTESVAWISGRTDLLAALFMCLAFIALLNARRTTAGNEAEQNRAQGLFSKPVLALPAAFIFLLLALWSKEVAVSLIPIYLVFEFVSTERGSKGARRPVAIVSVLVLVAAAGVYAGLRAIALGGISTGLASRLFSPWTGAGLATIANYTLQYLGKLALPLNLSADFEVQPFETLWRPLPILALLCAVGLLALSVFLLIRDRRAGFALWWMWLSLVPSLNFVPIAETTAERFAFVPSVGFCLLMGLLVARIMTRSRMDRRPAVLAMAGMLTLALGHGVLTVSRNRDWRTEHALSLSCVNTAPQVPRAQLGLGMIYENRELYRRALQHYKRAIELAQSQTAEGPRRAMPTAHRRAGACAQALGRLDEAVNHFKAAASLSPEEPEIRAEWANALGIWHISRSGRLEQAVAMFELAEKLDPASAESSYNKGVALQRMGNLSAAEAAYTEALRRNPRYYEPLYALAFLHFEQHRFTKALHEAERAYKMKPTDEARALVEAVKQEIAGSTED